MKNGPRQKSGRKHETLQNWTKWKHNIPKPMGHNEGCSKGQVHSIISQVYNTKKLASHLEVLEQREGITPKRSRWQEIMKMGAEINEIKTENKIKESVKWRAALWEKQQDWQIFRQFTWRRREKI